MCWGPTPDGHGELCRVTDTHIQALPNLSFQYIRGGGLHKKYLNFQEKTWKFIIFALCKHMNYVEKEILTYRTASLNNIPVHVQ
jgi:hypothetical protein